MKINWLTLVGLVKDLYFIIRGILSQEATDNNGEVKHANIRTLIRDLLMKREWWALKDSAGAKAGKFTNDDIDKVIHGVVWCIKKIYNLIKGGK